MYVCMYNMYTMLSTYSAGTAALRPAPPRLENKAGSRSEYVYAYLSICLSINLCVCLYHIYTYFGLTLNPQNSLRYLSEFRVNSLKSLLAIGFILCVCVMCAYARARVCLVSGYMSMSWSICIQETT